MKPVAKLTAVVVMICSIGLLTLSTVEAKPNYMWCNKMSDLLQSFQDSHPTADFEPYFQKQADLREATARGDSAALRAGITDVIRMVGRSDMDHDAAVEFVNYLYMWRATIMVPGKYTNFASSR